MGLGQAVGWGPRSQSMCSSSLEFIDKDKEKWELLVYES